METILLADDERIFKAVEGTCLRRERCRLLKASPDRLFDAAMQRRPDLVVTLSSDERTRQVLRRLCAERALGGIPIIVLEIPGGPPPPRASKGLLPKRVARAAAVERIAGSDSRLDSRLDAAIKRCLPALDHQVDRVSLSIPVRCRARRASFTVRTKNISPSGLFLKTERPLARGERFTISFSLPAASERPRRDREADADVAAEPIRIRGTCEVVRQVAMKERDEYDDLIPGMGVRFVEIDPETRSTLARFVRGGERPRRIARRAPGAHSTH